MSTAGAAALGGFAALVTGVLLFLCVWASLAQARIERLERAIKELGERHDF